MSTLEHQRAGFREGFPTVGTTDPQEALQKIRLGGCRAVIADFRMPAMDGLAFLEKVLQYDPGIYVILVTGYYSVDAAIYSNVLITGPTGSGKELIYRLSTVEIRVPGLRERTEDIPILIQHFLKKYSQAYSKPFQGLSRRAQIALLQHDWPGNVRELENAISSAALTASADFIDVTDLPAHLQKPRRSVASVAEENWRPIPLDEVRGVHIQRVLEMCNGNRVRASQVLGIGRTSLYRFLKRTTKKAQAKGAAQ